MTRCRKKVCWECGRVYYRLFRRGAGEMGWCRPGCYLKDYWRRRRAVEGRADSSGESSSQEAKMAEDGENAVLDIEVVADRPLVPQTRFEEDTSVRVEWRGRCWAWLTEGEPPALMDVAVSDREVVKLLEPGTVRRVRAIERAVETLEGPVGGLEVWMEFGGEPAPDRRATARGLWEGGKVRIAEGGLRAEINGKVATLLQFTVGTVEVDGKRYSIGLKDLERVDGPSEEETLTADTKVVPKKEEADAAVGKG